MRFQRLDLNLLVALQALLSEQSVSLAAERLCLSQSATSSALSRLRDYFNDELLTQKGRQMVLTNRGSGLLAAVDQVLDQIQATITIPEAFDPARCDRTISFLASDYITEVLLADAFLAMRGLAPHMRFSIQPLPDTTAEAMDRGTADFMITLDYGLSALHPNAALFQEDYVIVGCQDNVRLHDRLTREEYLSFDHVGIVFGKTRHASFDEAFTRGHAMKRNIVITTSSFTVVPAFLMGSDLITTMHRKLAVKMTNQLPLKMVPLPFEMPKMRFAVQWQKSAINDPALAWVVEQLQNVARRTSQAEA